MNTVQKNSQKISGGSGAQLACFLVAVFLMVIFKFSPAFQSFLLSFQSYSPLHGLSGSPWVGFENYYEFTNRFEWYAIVKNSLVLGILSNILPVVAGFFLGWILAKTVQGKWAGICLGCWLLPLFLPTQLYTGVAVWFGGAEWIIPYASILYMVIAGVRTLCFSVFLCGVCGYLYRSSGMPVRKGVLLGGGVLLFLCLTNCFTPSLEILQDLQNPMNYETTDVWDTYTYRTGMMSAEYSPSAAAWFLKLIFELPFFLMSAVLLCRFLKRPALLPQTINTKMSGEGRGSSLPGILSLVVTGIFCVLGMAAFLSLFPGSSPSFSVQAANSAIIAVISAVLFFGFLLLFGYGCTQNPRVAVVVGGLLLWISGNTVGEYMFYRILGVVNTIFPVVLNSIFQASVLVSFAVILFAVFADRPARRFSSWIRKALPFLLLFTGLGAANVWGSSADSVVYLSDASKYGVSMIVRNVLLMGSSAGTEEGVGMTQVLAVFCIVPFVIGVLSVLAFALTLRRSQEEK